MGADKPTGTALALAGSAVVRNGASLQRMPLSFRDLAQAATLAERTGYSALFVPDHGLWDPFTLLAGLAPRTDRLRLGPGVVTTTDRTPALLASAAATLDEVAGGRAVLGVGPGREASVARVRHALREVRSRLGADVPMFLAALGPRMAELAGEVADGVLLNWCPPARVERARREVERGAAAAGRQPGEVTVAVYVRACLGHEEAHALAALRDAVGTYAALPTYRRQLEAEGLGQEAAAAAEAHRSGDPEGVPISLVRALCVWGDRDHALARLSAWGDAGADLVVVYPVAAQEPASSLMGTIMAAAPNPAVEH